uniref:Uncharacterized protein n=1 Tax=Sphaerodactylus townsendi TaxID=933632 RepID=A0ACB8FKK4_9SAUR
MNDSSPIRFSPVQSYFSKSEKEKYIRTIFLSTFSELTSVACELWIISPSGSRANSSTINTFKRQLRVFGPGSPVEGCQEAGKAGGRGRSGQASPRKGLGEPVSVAEGDGTEGPGTGGGSPPSLAGLAFVAQVSLSAGRARLPVRPGGKSRNRKMSLYFFSQKLLCMNKGNNY